MTDFEPGDIVWAKVKGYPWWPGIVSKVDSQPPTPTVYEVTFIGDNSQYALLTASAKLPHDKLADFSLLFKKHYNSKDKKLMDAVKTTQQILLGNTTLEGSLL